MTTHEKMIAEGYFVYPTSKQIATDGRHFDFCQFGKVLYAKRKTPGHRQTKKTNY